MERKEVFLCLLARAYIWLRMIFSSIYLIPSRLDSFLLISNITILIRLISLGSIHIESSNLKCTSYSPYLALLGLGDKLYPCASRESWADYCNTFFFLSNQLEAYTLHLSPSIFSGSERPSFLCSSILEDLGLKLLFGRSERQGSATYLPTPISPLSKTFWRPSYPSMYLCN